MPEAARPTTEISEVAALLERMLPVGYALMHSHRRWYLRRFDSFTTRDGPRLGWPVDSDDSPAALLDRAHHPTPQAGEQEP